MSEIPEDIMKAAESAASFYFGNKSLGGVRLVNVIANALLYERIRQRRPVDYTLDLSPDDLTDDPKTTFHVQV